MKPNDELRLHQADAKLGKLSRRFFAFLRNYSFEVVRA